MIHMSIDDFFMAFKELTEKEEEYTSIFEQPVFALFREMNQKYNTVFHCYCFGEENLLPGEVATPDRFSLKDVTRKYRSEFEENAHWLKFGFHSINNESVYGEVDNDKLAKRDEKQAAEDYAYIIGQLLEIVGEKALDRNLRIHYFTGTRGCCEAWKNAAYGITGLLAADSERNSYYHNNEQYTKLLEDDVWHDEEMGLTFWRTHIRLEKEKDMELLKRKVREFKGDMQVIFTHECYLHRDDIQQKMLLCLQEGEKC